MWLKYYVIDKNNEKKYIGESVKSNKFIPHKGQILSLIDINGDYIQYKVEEIETVYDYNNFLESYEIYKTEIILKRYID